MRRSNRSELWRPSVEREVREELEHHLEMRFREYRAEGFSEAEARRRALERFGDPERHARECRRQARSRNRCWRLRRGAEELGQDVSFAARRLRRHPASTVLLVAMLALGLGTTAALSSLALEALCLPAPFAEPARLVTLWEEQTTRGKGKNVVSPANFLAWRDGLDDLASMTAFITVTANLSGDGEERGTAPGTPGAGAPERVRLRVATEGYFQLLGRPPAHGRFFTPEDAVEGAAPVVVLSHGLWQRRFGGRAGVVGETIRMDGEAYEVVGVTGPGQALDMGPSHSPYGDAAQIFAPLPVSERWSTPAGRWLMVLARLARGASVEGVRDSLDAVTARQLELHPEFNAGWEARAIPLETHLDDPVRLPLAALTGAALLVLVILFVNVSNLLLTRTLGRSRELAVRAALGAGRWRLSRQLLVEGALLAGVSGMLATAAAYGLRALLEARLPAELVSAAGAGAGSALLPISLASTALAAALFGLLLLAGSWRRTSELSRGPSSGPSRRLSRVRGALVFGQIVMALVLLVAAGLLVRTVRGLIEVDPGFETADTVAFSISPSRGLETPRLLAFYDELQSGLEGIPGVRAVGGVSHLPMASAGAGTSFWPADRPPPEPSRRSSAHIRILIGDYLEAMGVGLVEGRGFDARDRPGADPGSILVSESLARRFWPGETAIGQQLHVHWGRRNPRTIVGVVEDVYHAGPSVAPGDSIYFPLPQERETGMTLVLRGAPEAGALGILAPAIRRVVARQAPELPVYGLRSVESVVEGAVAEERFLARLLGVFAAVALLLAALGVYGVTALSVAQNTREIGVRSALGAAPGQLVSHYLGRTGRLVGAALVAGLVAAIALGRSFESLLFEVEATDPATLISTAALLFVTALGASLLPSLRAARLDTVRALRDE